jgi:predicted ATPase
MDYKDINQFSLFGLDKINVILGKNGSGKSYCLKKVEVGLKNTEGVGKVRYITPERAGFLKYLPNIEQAMTTNERWMDDDRRHNQSTSFKQQSVALYRRLELLTLREIEAEHTLPEYQPKNFQTIIDKINTLLDRIKIVRSDSGFEIVDKSSGLIAQPEEEISSGESELISLSIEFLSFIKESEKGKKNFLLIDEPDVHLHPDLQDRFASFLTSQILDTDVFIIIATHSTSLLGALSKNNFSRIAFMRPNGNELKFSKITEAYRKILPIFGAHPLSNVFNEAPILILEGEDDKRVWQQAVRSSLGKINVYPCEAESVSNLAEFEKDVNDILDAVYDNAKGYSLRDRDSMPEEIDDIGHIIRMRLGCRASENLILSDDVLSFAGTDWSNIQSLIKNFVAESLHHPYHKEVKEFYETDMDRKNTDIKSIRLILAGFISKKPWEVLVGQAIASLCEGKTIENGENSLKAYLGEKVCAELCKF